MFKRQDGILKIYHSILELIGHTPIVKLGNGIYPRIYFLMKNNVI